MNSKEIRTHITSLADSIMALRDSKVTHRQIVEAFTGTLPEGTAPRAPLQNLTDESIIPGCIKYTISSEQTGDRPRTISWILHHDPGYHRFWLEKLKLGEEIRWDTTGLYSNWLENNEDRIHEACKAAGK